MQAAALPEEEVPGKHFWQESAEFEPVTGLNLPTSQEEQAEEPAPEYVPATQSPQSARLVAAVVFDIVPAEQSTQLEELAAAVDAL